MDIREATGLTNCSIHIMYPGRIIPRISNGDRQRQRLVAGGQPEQRTREDRYDEGCGQTVTLFFMLIFLNIDKKMIRNAEMCANIY